MAARISPFTTVESTSKLTLPQKRADFDNRTEHSLFTSSMGIT
mgnify:CR=1 FL=1|jgi:hypothetical protein